MRCYHPLVGVISLKPNKNGNYPLLVKGSLQKASREGWLSPEHIRIQCGKCIGCRMDYSAQWAIRISHETQMQEEAGNPSIFLTLTFDDEHLPTDESINKKHIQKFIKRLRKKYTGRKISYYAVGEYGEKSRRPHYHLIIFNCEFKDKELWTVKNGHSIYTSEILTRLWSDPDTHKPYGFANYGSVTYESAAYVARYSTKKQYGTKAKDHYTHVTRYGELVDLTPEFALMSTKPPIGLSWLNKYGSDIFPSDYVLRSGKNRKIIQKVPTFYYRKLQELDPETASAVREKRIEKISSGTQLSYDRLQAAKKIFLAKTKNLKRDLEERI